MKAVPMEGNRFLIQCIGDRDDQSITRAGLYSRAGKQIYDGQVTKISESKLISSKVYTTVCKQTMTYH